MDIYLGYACVADGNTSGRSISISSGMSAEDSPDSVRSVSAVPSAVATKALQKDSGQVQIKPRNLFPGEFLHDNDMLGYFGFNFLSMTFQVSVWYPESCILRRFSTLNGSFGGPSIYVSALISLGTSFASMTPSIDLLHGLHFATTRSRQALVK